jgi:3'-phosphoadenosine 5'-phosphosulfate sulfotransferase (PAPS reductase)/FAD synthetase
MTSPYRIEGPALISFSGGRTSGYMLKHILDECGGLPADTFVVFADTGKEHPATYRFIDICAAKWGVEVHTVTMDRGNHATPYDALIVRKNYLPNPVARFCTQELKIKPVAEFMRQRGYCAWTNVLGIRADEAHRATSTHHKREWANLFPLILADVSRADVMAWWAKQPFDLGIPPGFGNCVGCFLKSRAQLIAIEQAEPGSLEWWAEKEVEIGGTFRSDREDYAKLIQFASAQGVLPLADDSALDCFCGEP